MSGCIWGHDEIDECDVCGGCRECGDCHCGEDFYDEGEDDTMVDGYA